jgi:hypothetical protein
LKIVAGSFILLFTTIFLLKPLETFSQSKNYYTMADSIYFAKKTDSLRLAFPFVTNIPADIQTAVYAALSHYPELQQTRITFIQKTIKTTMATRPAFTLFKNRTKREYRVYINTRENFSGVYLSQLNFDQQVGIIGHEFAHIVDYSRKSAFRLIGNGIGYLFASYRKKYEASTDIRTIKHGLGWQLYDYVDFLLNHSHASEAYLKMKRRIYMNEEQIEAIIIR